MRTAPPTATHTTLRYHIDRPKDFARFSNTLLRVVGWCFARKGSPQVCSLRVRCDNGLLLTAPVSLPRPEVKKAYPDVPGDFVGFELRGILPSGQQKIVLEALLEDGSAQTLVTCQVHIPKKILPLWLRPAPFYELFESQVSNQPLYPPRPIAPETFPKVPPRERLRDASPRFSIVTPSYNQARWLGETIQSVLDQPGVQVDYVVQDGGSTDGSVALIERHAARLHAWESGPDGGQSNAIIKGFAKTTGGPDDIMAWINSDDFYLPGALRYVARYFAAHPEVDAVYGHRIIVDGDSQEVSRWVLPKHDPKLLLINDCVPQETLFWRRRLWDKVGGLNPDYHYAMDWELLLRFQAAGARIVRLPYFLGCFRVHEMQKSYAAIGSGVDREGLELRQRTLGKARFWKSISKHPRMLWFLRRAAFTEWLWKRGIRI